LENDCCRGISVHHLADVPHRHLSWGQGYVCCWEPRCVACAAVPIRTA
jgi:hypothetical protein